MAPPILIKESGFFNKPTMRTQNNKPMKHKTIYNQLYNQLSWQLEKSPK